MKHVRHLEDAQLDRASVVTIGVFDGLHRGHQTLINRLVDAAHTSNRLAAVVTFFPHPDVVLRGIEGRYYLTTPEQRAVMMLEMGVDCVVTHPFDEEIRQMPAADFVKKLCQHLQMSALWVGEDFALGHQREGNVAFLTEQGHKNNFAVQALKPVEIDNQIINSTQIREMLFAGDVDIAAKWLGRNYSVQGEIVHGQQRGRTIGFPTANVAVPDEQLIPSNGVYCGWATIEGDSQPYMAVTNIGVRPTFDGEGITVEAHLLDFNADIYGKEMTLTFEKRLRDEQKFNGLDALIAQLNQDVATGREYLKKSEGNKAEYS